MAEEEKPRKKVTRKAIISREQHVESPPGLLEMAIGGLDRMFGSDPFPKLVAALATAQKEYNEHEDRHGPASGITYHERTGLLDIYLPETHPLTDSSHRREALVKLLNS